MAKSSTLKAKNLSFIKILTMKGKHKERQKERETMRHWLVKSEPFKYSWAQLLKDKRTFWDGVRNYQARNNLQAMKKGDHVLFYHSNEELAVVGVAVVVKEAYQDPTTEDVRWVAVDIEPLETLKTSVTLDEMKQEERLQNIALIRQSRLSVMPLNKEEFALIAAKGREKREK